MASCDRQEGSANLKVHVNDFSITQEDFPTKGALADYSGVKAITLAIYASNGSEVYKLTQLRADNSTYTTFGDFETPLSIGNYTMVVLGYGSTEPITITSPTSAEFTADKVRETFIAVQAVNVSSTEDIELTASLTRKVSKLAIQSTDGRPEGVDSVRVSFSAGGKAFNPTTGLATADTGLVNTVGISSSVGNTTLTNGYIFLASDQETMTLTIDALNSDGVSVSHKVVNNVPLQRNRVTLMTGSLYTAGGSNAFTVETGFDADTNFVNF